MGIKMKNIILFVLVCSLAGCTKDKPKEIMEGGFASMKACISDVKLKTGHIPVVEFMNDTKVSGRYDGMKRSQGIWTCELKPNKTNYPFYGFYSIEKS
jgi:hypothetical protein